MTALRCRATALPAVPAPDDALAGTLVGPRVSTVAARHSIAKPTLLTLTLQPTSTSQANTTTMATVGAPPEWQNVIRARLMAQQTVTEPLKDVIEQCECPRRMSSVPGTQSASESEEKL